MTLTKHITKDLSLSTDWYKALKAVFSHPAGTLIFNILNSNLMDFTVSFYYKMHLVWILSCRFLSLCRNLQLVESTQWFRPRQRSQLTNGGKTITWWDRTSNTTSRPRWRAASRPTPPSERPWTRSSTTAARWVSVKVCKNVCIERQREGSSQTFCFWSFIDPKVQLG